MAGSNYHNLGAIAPSDLLEVSLNLSTGVNPLVASGTGIITMCYRMLLCVNGTGITVAFSNGTGATSAITGNMALSSGALVLPFDGNPWFTTSAGQPLVIVVAGTGSVAGRLYYLQT